MPTRIIRTYVSFHHRATIISAQEKSTSSGLVVLWFVLQLLQKELAYAEAQVARFENGTALQPGRSAAQRRYSQLMEGIGERFQ